MMLGRWKTAAVFIGAAAAALALGIGAGSIYADAKAKARERAKIEEKQAYLSATMRGIGIGQAFPQLSVRDPTTKKEVKIDEILPHGGLLVYVSADCPSCFDALLQLDSAIQAVSPAAKEVVVLAGGDTQELLSFSTAHAFSYPLLEDVDQVLMRQNHVLVFPAYFELDAQGVVVRMGADADKFVAFRELIAL